MRLWPRTLLSRLSLIFLLGLLLANGLSLSLLLYERMESAKTVMLDNMEFDVATSVAIIDRVPAAERSAWIDRLGRGNYHYLLSAGQSGNYPTSKHSREAAKTLIDALGKKYRLTINSIPDKQEHLQAHLTLNDGSPLTIDLKPHPVTVANWLPAVLIAQLLLLCVCSWFAVRLAVRPLTALTSAAESLDPNMLMSSKMSEKGPAEVRYAARAFNAMQERINTYLKERAHILASISHDLQTPITRMKLRAELADQPELRDKLLQDLDEMTHLVREGIAYARTSESVEEKALNINVDAFINSLVCDYQDVGKAVSLHGETGQLLLTRPKALRRVLSNLIDNALKFAGSAEVAVKSLAGNNIDIVITDRGPGIPEAELEAVLQPFYRVESSRNRDTGGTGLGLAIAQQLAHAIGGNLMLSNRDGGGLLVSVRVSNLHRDD